MQPLDESAPSARSTDTDQNTKERERLPKNHKIMSSLINFVKDQFLAKQTHPSFSSGDTITVYYEIKEGNKKRVQFFKGIVLQRRGSSSTETFTIRKMSGSIGVERIFPVHAPIVDSIEVIRKGKVRRSKLYYLRDRVGKSAKIKEDRN